MFARIKKSGKNHYLQIVENRREGKKIIQRVIATIGRMDQLHARGDIETLIRSLSRFSEKTLLVLSGKGDVRAEAKKIGPSLIFARLWEDLSIGRVIKDILAERNFLFDVERAIFLTVLHRLFASGSDRFCDLWRRALGSVPLCRARSCSTERLSKHDTDTDNKERHGKRRKREKCLYAPDH